MMKYRAAILRNESELDHLLWVKACQNNSSIVDYDIIDITKDDWLGKINEAQFDLLLLRPPGRIALFKQLYDERTIILSSRYQNIMYPSLNEVLIYENKRFHRDWLIINSLPHPKTSVFFNLKEARKHILLLEDFPIVGKLNIGASGNGVKFLHTSDEALQYCERAFTKGISPSTGPKLKKGSSVRKIQKALTQKGFLRQRFKDYGSADRCTQNDFIILQEFVPHSFEWRCVRIGDSFFAHKKIVDKNKASGSLKKEYCDVPFSLLDFIKNITNEVQIHSAAVDVFEDDNGNYLINEIQCFFGQSDEYQMLVNGKPGRYIYSDNEWQFQEGDFNTNESYDLRLEHALSIARNQ